MCLQQGLELSAEEMRAAPRLERGFECFPRLRCLLVPERNDRLVAPLPVQLGDGEVAIVEEISGALFVRVAGPKTSFFEIF